MAISQGELRHRRRLRFPGETFGCFWYIATEYAVSFTMNLREAAADFVRQRAITDKVQNSQR
jgi:hypothetical protein